MNKTHIIQSCIDKIKANTYLEIGVEHGHNFMHIKAPVKIAVDKKFLNLAKRKMLGFLRNEHFFEISSDDFFQKNDQLLANGLDVAFIDGNHTFEQSLRDFKNCLPLLNDNGIILLHDCNPPSEAIGYPAESYEAAATLGQQFKIPGWNGCWCGDVWKTIVYIQSFHPAFEVTTFDLDWGIGIVSKRNNKNNKPLNYSLSDIQEMDYNFFSENRNSLLNLVEPATFFDFIKNL